VLTFAYVSVESGRNSVGLRSHLRRYRLDKHMGRCVVATHHVFDLEITF
jgi:hypothetical protein